MSKKSETEKTLLKAAKRLRKAVKGVNRWDDKTLAWCSTYLPPDANNKRPAYWVQENTTTASGCEGARTVADVSWNLDDAIYIALMHPPIALQLAKLFEIEAEWAKDGWGKTYSSGSSFGATVDLAKMINEAWESRAVRS